MTPFLLLILVVSIAAFAVISVGFTDTRTEPDPPAAAPCVGECVPRSQLVAAQKLAARRLAGWNRANRQIIRLKRPWRVTSLYAIALASRVEGVPESEMLAVARCESTLNPFAVNGKYRGLFQLGWSPFGFSPYDPVANALSAAATVRHDGSWRQWSCKP